MKNLKIMNSLEVDILKDETIEISVTKWRQFLASCSGNLHTKKLS